MDRKQSRSLKRIGRRDQRANGGVYSDHELKRSARVDCWEEYTEQMAEAISHYIETGFLTRRANPVLPDFFVRTQLNACCRNL